MSEQIAGTDHARSYDARAREIGAVAWRRVPIMAGVAVSLLVLLRFLESPLHVWAYVTVLFLVAAVGFRRVGAAVSASAAAFKHLTELAAFLAVSDNRSSKDLQDFLKPLLDPDDDSNVPESVWSLSVGHRSGESVRVAANGMFSHSLTQLAFVHFLRTSLVLGGLFGTVLFFALELNGAVLSADNIPVLMRGLKGALASTLSGILGSVTLGYLASELERVIERATWESEAFLIGPVWQAIDQDAAPKSVNNEVELWTALRAEVATLSAETRASYGRLASETAAYTASLAKISTQLTELPAVKVPEGLANLEQVVDRFARGAESLSVTAKTLVDAVGAMGVFAPAKALQQLDALGDAVLTGHSTLQSSLSDVVAAVRTASNQVSEIRAGVEGSIAIARQIDARGVRLEESGKVLIRGQEVVSGHVMNAVSTVERMAGDTRGLREDISAARADLTQIKARLPLQKTAGAPPSPIAPVPPPTPSVVVPGPLCDLGDQFADQSRALTTVRERLGELVQRSDTIESEMTTTRTMLSSLQTAIAQQSTFLRRVEFIHAWHERAAAAPLMRMLLFPFRRSQVAGGANGT